MGRENPVSGLDLTQVPSPAFIVNEDLLRENLRILASVKQRTGCEILLALKGFAMFSVFPLVREYLDGVCASSPDEARLGREEFNKQVHAFAAAYSDSDITEMVKYIDHLVFNSFTQRERFRNRIPTHISCGLRVNPEYSEVHPPIYNPCSPNSRLGITLKHFQGRSLDGIRGLHFHTHCEQNSDVLERTLVHVEEKFGAYFKGLEWVNFGGGHHITRDDYNVDKLCALVSRFKDKYKVQVILEPGEAVALNTGVLVATVLDIVNNGMDLAILDTSAATHMPDVLEMPYRPKIVGAGEPDQLPHTYRLGGLSCLAGDIIGDYSFARPLTVGDKLIFLDMGHYSMVKTNTFNGVRLPSICIWRPPSMSTSGLTGGSIIKQTALETGTFNVVRKFGYEDFKGRLS